MADVEEVQQWFTVAHALARVPCAGDQIQKALETGYGLAKFALEQVAEAARWRDRAMRSEALVSQGRTIQDVESIVQANADLRARLRAKGEPV